ncbi:MAG: barstar family protein [Actinomycetota bacterium]|nr:barstar family protein [Actinomycetota bacterium]
MSAKQAAINAVYSQLGAPDWAAPNLDALADVLRDLSWLPEGGVEITLPDLADLDGADLHALLEVLRRVSNETAQSPRPVRIRL